MGTVIIILLVWWILNCIKGSNMNYNQYGAPQKAMMYMYGDRWEEARANLLRIRIHTMRSNCPGPEDDDVDDDGLEKMTERELRSYLAKKLEFKGLPKDYDSFTCKVKTIKR